MRKITTKVFAASASLIEAKILGLDGVESGILLLLTWSSSMLPDSLEYAGFVRWIRHRTLTHWMLPWLTGWCAGFLLYSFFDVAAGIVLLGVFGGGLLHVVTDLLTPKGVPIFLPLSKHQVSLKLVNGTGSEIGITMLIFMVSVSLWYQDILYIVS